MSAQRISKGMALLLFAIIVALTGCATHDVRPSIEIGAQFNPDPADREYNEDRSSSTQYLWRFGASLKATFTEHGPIFEPCAAADWTISGIWREKEEPKIHIWGFPAEVCVAVAPRE